MQRTLSRQARAVGSAQHSPRQIELVAVNRRQQGQHIAIAAGHSVVGKAEIEVADLHAAKPPHSAAAVQNRYAQQHHMLPCIQQLCAFCPQAALRQTLHLTGGNLIAAGNQRGIQLRIPAVMHLKLQSPRRLRRAAEADHILLRRHRGLKSGIAQIQSRPERVRVGQRRVGGHVQTKEDPAARGGAQRAAQRRVQSLFQFRDGFRIVVERVKRNALGREKSIQLPAQLFRHGHAMRRQLIHLRIHGCICISLLDVQGAGQLPRRMGQHARSHQDRQDGRHQQQRHCEPIQQQPHTHTVAGCIWIVNRIPN